jgi:virulence-associated protein VagC
VPWKTEVREGVVEVIDGDRIIRIPKDFVLVGDAISICQEKDGTISIYPATEEGRRALDSFSPFGDWTEEDWKRAEEYDWSTHPIFARTKAKT